MSQQNIPNNKSYTRKKIQNYSYGLNDTIGKGYSSQVYRGRNDSTDQPVAIKVIDLKMLKNQINKTLLASQIEILKSMRNISHILTLNQVYTTRNNTYIITQLCQTDLSSKIKKGLSQSESLTFMAQILEGYSYIYEKSLIHRDLKPANLLITKENQIKIADFGFGIKAQEVLKPSKYNVGSPLYMAPQSLKRNQYSFKTDIWALGIIFFQMLTGDTPWRAKNQKELLKKIQGESIQQILSKQKFASLVKQFLSKALNQDKNQRIGPQQLLKYNFKPQELGVLGQRQMNITTKAQRFESIINEAPSPKNFNYIGKSIQKRIFTTHDKSQKKLIQPKAGQLNSTNQTLQNISVKNIENIKTVITASIETNNTINATTTSDTMSKEDKKFISKLLIAQVHFCRFLYKLIGRIKQSMASGMLKDNSRANNLIQYFTKIIEQKITKLKDFQQQCYLNIDKSKYDDYRKTADYKKLIKISKDYYNRYSSELSQFWSGSRSKSNKMQTYRQSIEQIITSIEYLLTNLQVKSFSTQKAQIKSFLDNYSKDIIILDYLITCKQLLEMIEKEIKINGCENYEKFAKKSRIQEIVEGSTSQINKELYEKIAERGRIVTASKRDNTQY